MIPENEYPKIQIIFPEGESRYRKVKIMFDGKQLPVKTFEILPSGEMGYQLLLKIGTPNFEVSSEKENA